MVSRHLFLWLLREMPLVSACYSGHFSKSYFFLPDAVCKHLTSSQLFPLPGWAFSFLNWEREGWPSIYDKFKLSTSTHQTIRFQSSEAGSMGFFCLSHVKSSGQFSQAEPYISLPTWTFGSTDCFCYVITQLLLSAWTESDYILIGVF